ncbi:hypothetical protein G4G27_22195 [Sphingomonas sp. So64.6b]|uniref:hypothetical protein n=1 Tax=Sphingomonas sp. So64.6b TaxID=2997354 RepID=UPI0016033253|nr:hypothetical protein [Sphingomonas sp. So64.6b]QNA86388.1 hypothetical protein G4G27_22195 [Sphingomonas sp. So64.6b]
MSIEAIAAAAAGAAPTPPTETLQAGPNASVADINGFQDSLTSVSQGAAPFATAPALDPSVKAVFDQLEKVNGEAKSVSEYAKAAEASGMGMSPGEVVNLTMRCHEFMFHCQLTSNIANRTSDGIQQLFRQQS